MGTGGGGLEVERNGGVRTVLAFFANHVFYGASAAHLRYSRPLCLHLTRRIPRCVTAKRDLENTRYYSFLCLGLPIASAAR